LIVGDEIRASMPLDYRVVLVDVFEDGEFVVQLAIDWRHALAVAADIMGVRDVRGAARARAGAGAGAESYQAAGGDVMPGCEAWYAPGRPSGQVVVNNSPQPGERPSLLPRSREARQTLWAALPARTREQERSLSAAGPALAQCGAGLAHQIFSREAMYTPQALAGVDPVRRMMREHIARYMLRAPV
jgi:hypothetical protein